MVKSVTRHNKIGVVDVSLGGPTFCACGWFLISLRFKPKSRGF